MRLIDADILKSTIEVDGYEHFSGCLSSSEVSLLEMVKDDIDDAPTVDAVPVVRCRECNQGEIDDQDFPDQYYCHAGCGWNNGDFYCSYGERKECDD